MYKIYKENELIWTNSTPETGLYSAKISLGVNGANTFEASVASGLELFKDLPVLNKRIFIFQDNEKDPIFEGRLLKRVTDFYGNTTYSFEGALGYLHDSIQPPVDYTGQTIETIFNGLLTEHNKQVEDWKQLLPGRITVEDHTESDTYSGKGRLDDTNADREVYTADSDTTGINQANLTTGYETTWDAINNLLINNLAGYLVIRYEGNKKYLDYLKEYMPSEGQVILFGSNLLDYSSTLDYGSLCTGVLPLGYSKGADSGDGSNSEDDRAVYTQESDPLSNVKNKLTIESVNGGSKILWNQDAVNNYGRIVKSVEWSDCKDASKLLDKARKYLTNTQFDNLSLECKIIDLHFVDNTEGPLHCMHLVRVKSEPHGLDKMMPISSMEIDLMNPANDIITIGQTYNSLTGEFAGTQNDVSSLSGTTSNITQTIENNVKTAWTNIQKTDDAITLEAHERQKSEDELHEKITSEYDAAIEITAREINSTISENQKKNDETFASYSSRINQTAHDISTEVSERQKGDNDLQTDITSVRKQTPTSFSLGFKNNDETNNVLTLTYNVDNQEKKAEINLTTFIMTVLQKATVKSGMLTYESTDGVNSSTFTGYGLGTTGKVWAHHFITSNNPSSTSSGGSGNQVTLYGQRRIICGTDDPNSDTGINAKHTIYLDSSGYDENGNKRDGIRFDCDLFCGANNSMVATRKWVSENFKTGYIKKSAVGVNTTIYGSGVESKYPTYAEMRDRKNQLRDQLSDYKSSHKYSNTEYNNKTATVHTTISGAESNYPTYASLQARKNQLVDWVRDLRAQVRAGCAKGTTPVH